MKAGRRTREHDHIKDWVIVDDLLHQRRKPPREPTLLEVREAVYVLKHRGWTDNAIAQHLGTSMRVVREHLDALLAHQAKRGQGATSCSTPAPRGAE